MKYFEWNYKIIQRFFTIDFDCLEKEIMTCLLYFVRCAGEVQHKSSFFINLNC